MLGPHHHHAMCVDSLASTLQAFLADLSLLFEHLSDPADCARYRLANRLDGLAHVMRRLDLHPLPAKTCGRLVRNAVVPLQVIYHNAHVFHVVLGPDTLDDRVASEVARLGDDADHALALPAKVARCGIKHAIIPAATSEGAVDVLVKDDRYTSLCKSDRVIESVIEVTPPILYFWNGDY